MSTPLSDLKAPSQDRPSQNIMYDPNMKEETKKMESNTKPDDMTELISGIQENKQFVTLPSSDIPTTSSHLSTDTIIQPNHIQHGYSVLIQPCVSESFIAFLAIP